MILVLRRTRVVVLRRIKMSAIAEIGITNLFGHLGYRIPLNMTDNITIIHGPNGCGKTWILQIINAIFSLNYSFLMRAPFDLIEFEFRDGGHFVVRRDGEERLAPFQPAVRDTDWSPYPSIKLTFTYSSRRTKKPKEFFLRAESERSSIARQLPLSIIEREIPGLSRIGPREWLDESRREVLTLEEVRQVYGHRLPWMSRFKATPNWLSELTERVDINFIQSQRLIRMPIPTSRHESPSRRDITEMVEHDSQEIAGKIQDTLSQSAGISQSLDRTFPTRLMSRDYFKIELESELREELNKKDLKRQALYAAGLLKQEEEVPLPEKSMSDIEKNVLSLYLQDTETKLHVFNYLQNRISTLMDLINSKFQPHGKSLTIDRNRGFVLKTDIGSGRTFRPAELSSGEQQQLVMFYELLFKTSRKSLVLIDEPEISLDVGWQRRFLDDLAKVIKIDRCSILMATHSPQIIHNRRDLTVPLGGGVLE